MTWLEDVLTSKMTWLLCCAGAAIADIQAAMLDMQYRQRLSTTTGLLWLQWSIQFNSYSLVQTQNQQMT